MILEINGITDDPYQTFTVSVPNSSYDVTFTLRYLPTQEAWYLDFEHNTVIENSIKLVLSPNILRGYRNILPFGLLVESTFDDGIYPMELDAFSSGRIRLCLLDKEAVDSLEKGLYGE